MADRSVQLSFYLTIGGTDAKGEFKTFLPESVREAVEASVSTDNSKREAAGLFDNTCQAMFRPNKNLTFWKEHLEDYRAGEDIAVVYRPKDAAKSGTNPELTFNILILQGPPFGGEHGALVEKSMTYRINGPITVDDNTTQWTIG